MAVVGLATVFAAVRDLAFAAAVAICAAVFGLAAGLASVVAALAAIYELSGRGGLRELPAPAIALVTVAVLAHLVERYVSRKIRSRVKPLLGIRGQLDGIKDGVVYGWAMDCDRPSEPVLVAISVDSRPAAEIAAVYYRPDLEIGLQSSGSYGFYADLSSGVAIEKEALVEARISNGPPLLNSPQQMRIPPRATPDGPTVLFMHIPKTAGIAFREAIVENYREPAVACMYGTAPGFLVRDLRRLPLEQRRGLRFVIGHFQYGIHHDLPQEALYVTLVREPVARLLSHYAFLERTQPELLREGGRVLTLETLVEMKPHVHFDNALVRHFGGVDEREFSAGAVNEQLYEKAVYYLRTGFTFVGHQEFAANAYHRLQQRFGWYARPELEIVNAGLRRLQDARAESIRAACEAHNRWDILLYKEILKLFPLGD